jgi:hypothetical protein
MAPPIMMAQGNRFAHKWLVKKLHYRIGKGLSDISNKGKRSPLEEEWDADETDFYR